MEIEIKKKNDHDMFDVIVSFNDVIISFFISEISNFMILIQQTVSAGWRRWFWFVCQWYHA